MINKICWGLLVLALIASFGFVYPVLAWLLLINILTFLIYGADKLAACKSWQRDAARARIQYAEVRHVKPMRNAPAGTVRIDKSLPSREVPVDSTLEEKLLPR